MMFLIENRVVFDPEKYSLSDGNTSLRLNPSACRCLSELIKARGEPINRREMINRVWKNEGVCVSDASVRQTLHLLRKAFSEMGLPAVLIRTTRYKGYSIDIHRIDQITRKGAPQWWSPSSWQRNVFVGAALLTGLILCASLTP